MRNATRRAIVTPNETRSAAQRTKRTDMRNITEHALHAQHATRKKNTHYGTQRNIAAQATCAAKCNMRHAKQHASSKATCAKQRNLRHATGCNIRHAGLVRKQTIRIATCDTQRNTHHATQQCSKEQRNARRKTQHAPRTACNLACDTCCA